MFNDGPAADHWMKSRTYSKINIAERMARVKHNYPIGSGSSVREASHHFGQNLDPHTSAVVFTSLVKTFH